MTPATARYIARPTGHRDALGLPDFALIDTRYGSYERIYTGYFAEADARAAAARRNQKQEVSDHE